MRLIPVAEEGRDGNGIGVIIQAPEAFQFDTIDDVLQRHRGGENRDRDRRRRSRERRRSDHGGGKGDAADDQLHDHARPRADLRADLERARRSARPATDGGAKSRNVSDRFHRLGRRRERRDDRDQRARSRRDHPHHRAAEIHAGRSRPAGPHLSPAREGRRRSAARRSHRSGGRSRADGRTATGRRALRNPARRRNDGAPARS